MASRSCAFAVTPFGVRQEVGRGHAAVRYRASRSDPFGLCLAEDFGNSLEDSVSFRVPPRQSLDGSPLLRPLPLTVAWLLDGKRHIDEVVERKGATKILNS